MHHIPPDNPPGTKALTLVKSARMFKDNEDGLVSYNFLDGVPLDEMQHASLARKTKMVAEYLNCKVEQHKTGRFGSKIITSKLIAQLERDLSRLANTGLQTVPTDVFGLDFIGVLEEQESLNDCYRDCLLSLAAEMFGLLGDTLNAQVASGRLGLRTASKIFIGEE